MAKPYCSDFKIITGIFQVPKIFGFCCEYGNFNLAQLILFNIVEEYLSSVNNVEHLNIILGQPKA